MPTHLYAWCKHALNSILLWDMLLCTWVIYIPHLLPGAIPYEDLPMASVLAQIISGYRLPMPENASDKMWAYALCHLNLNYNNDQSILCETVSRHGKLFGLHSYISAYNWHTILYNRVIKVYTYCNIVCSCPLPCLTWQQISADVDLLEYWAWGPPELHPVEVLLQECHCCWQHRKRLHQHWNLMICWIPTLVHI